MVMISENSNLIIFPKFLKTKCTMNNFWIKYLLTPTFPIRSSTVIRFWVNCQYLCNFWYSVIFSYQQYISMSTFCQKHTSRNHLYHMPRLKDILLLSRPQNHLFTYIYHSFASIRVVPSRIKWKVLVIYSTDNHKNYFTKKKILLIM